MSKKNKKKAFTLVEVLVAIIILGIILIIAVPSINKYIDDSKNKAFFISVSNIVNAIKNSNVLYNNEYCIYSYKDDTNNQTDNINSMYVLVHKDGDKQIYSVFATRTKSERGIDVYDFSTLSISKSSDWAQNPMINKSYTWYATTLLSTASTGAGNNPDKRIEELSSFRVCNIK